MAAITSTTETWNGHSFSEVQTYINGRLNIYSATTIGANQTNVTCPTGITGTSNSGAQGHILYVNSGSSADYTVTVSTNYKTPDGKQLNLKCPKSGYCEINYLNIGGTIYARGV